MNVISETLKGMHSFRGTGLIQINGQHVGVCGSRVINAGNGCRVKYCAEQLTKCEAEPEFIGVLPVTFISTGVHAGEAPIFDATTGKGVLYSGQQDGLDLGCEDDGGVLYLNPAFIMTVLSSGGVVKDAKQILADDVGYYPQSNRSFLTLRPQ